MDEHTLKRCLSKHPHTQRYFRGVFAKDEIHPPLLPNSIYIVNHSVRKMGGNHWICIWVTPECLVCYIDPIGAPPPVCKEFERLLEREPLYIFSQKRVQHPLSISCGKFCLLFALYLARGKSVVEARQVFGENLAQNERIVEQKFHKEFGWIP